MVSWKRELAYWAWSCACRVAPYQTDREIRAQVYTKLSQIASCVDKPEHVVKLSASAIIDMLLLEIWPAYFGGGSSAEHQRLDDVVVNQLHRALRAAYDKYGCICSRGMCCVSVATESSLIYAVLDEAFGCIASLPQDQRLSYTDYLAGAVCVIMEATFDSLVRAALWSYDPALAV